jgi:hypothetical protein
MPNPDKGTLMKRVLILTPLALAALAGCAPATNQIEAGQWELVTETQSIALSNASEEVRDQLQSRTGRPNSDRLCLTDEQARRLLELPKQFVSGGNAAACHFTDETYTNGVLHLAGTCPAGSAMGGPSGNLTNSLEGRFTATTFNSTVHVQGPNLVAPGGGDMSVTISLRGRRIGDCPRPTTPPVPSGL